MHSMRLCGFQPSRRRIVWIDANELFDEEDEGLSWGMVFVLRNAIRQTSLDYYVIYVYAFFIYNQAICDVMQVRKTIKENCQFYFYRSRTFPDIIFNFF